MRHFWGRANIRPRHQTDPASLLQARWSNVCPCRHAWFGCGRLIGKSVETVCDCCFGCFFSTLNTCRSKERTVDGIIYLYPVNRTRVTASLKEHEDLLKILAGENWEKKTLFVTTMWDEVGEEDGHRTHLQLETKHWSQAKDKGARVDRFLGGRPNAWRLILGICQPNTSRVPPLVSPSIPIPARSDPVDAEKLKTKAVSPQDIVIA